MNIDALAGRVANRMRREIGDESTAVVMDSIYCELTLAERAREIMHLAQEYGLLHTEIEIEQAKRAA
jgi:hypothetical protein